MTFAMASPDPYRALLAGYAAGAGPPRRRARPREETPAGRSGLVTVFLQALRDAFRGTWPMIHEDHLVELAALGIREEGLREGEDA